MGIHYSNNCVDLILRLPYKKAHDLARKDRKETFACTCNDKDVLRTWEILDLNDDLKKLIDWNPGDKEASKLERNLSEKANEVVNRQVKELGKKFFCTFTLDIRGNIRDDNGKELLHFGVIHYSSGIEDTRQ